MPPPRRPKKLLASAQRKKWRRPAPDEIDSSTIVASGGTLRATSRISVSGDIGTCWAAASARRSRPGDLKERLLAG
jgi:hypothetical protein